MITLNLIAALAVFAALSLGLALLDYIADKLRLAVRWRRWYYRTFGRR